MHTCTRPEAERASGRTTSKPFAIIMAGALVSAVLLASCGRSTTDVAADRPDPATADRTVDRSGVEATSGSAADRGEVAGTTNGNDDGIDRAAAVTADNTDDNDDNDDNDNSDKTDGTDGTDGIDRAGAIEPLDDPDTALAEIESQLKAPAVAVRGSEVLNVVEPLDGGPAPGTAIDIRDGVTINEAGEPNVLDEEAALACGHAEIALTALDEGDRTEAADHVRSAADQAAASSLAGFDQWSSPLAAMADELTTTPDPDLIPLLALLTSCIQGGYEL